MKQFLFSCVAISCLYAGISYAQGADQQKVPANTQQTADMSHDTKQSSHLDPKLVYTVEENTILEALENFLYFSAMDDTRKTDVRQDGQDFIITITNPKVLEQKPAQIRMVRSGEFMSKPQYKMSHASWDRYKQEISKYIGQDTVTVNSYSEDLTWVPELGILTNQSIKASDIRLQFEDVVVSVKSMVSDSLIRESGDKMDIASMSSMTGLKLTTPYVTIEVPNETQNMQMTDAALSADSTMQVLTASDVQFSSTIPLISISSPVMPGQTLTAKMSTTGSFTKTFNIDSTISDIKMSGNNMIALPLLPQTITSKLTVDGLSKDLLIAYFTMQNQLNEMDENTPEAQELEQKLNAAGDQLLSTLVLNINELSVENDQAGLHLTGQIKYAEPSFNATAKLTVTNFDLISPKPAPINEQACKAALERMTGQERQLPPQCIQNAGLLEALRPYLPTAQHSVNAKGQSVDIFTIVYTANALTVNGQTVFKADNLTSPQTKEITPLTSKDEVNTKEVPLNDAVQENIQETIVISKNGEAQETLEDVSAEIVEANKIIEAQKMLDDVVSID